MRIKVTLHTPEANINLNYNYYVSSLIYHLLRNADTQYSSMLHKKGYMLGNRQFKLFTFSALFPEKYGISNSILKIEGKTVLYVSSPMSEFMLHLAEGLLSAQKVNIDRSEFSIDTVEVLPEPEFKREMQFTCLSPITTSTVEEHEGKKRAIPCTPGSAKFAENIKNNLIRKYYVIRGKLPDDLSFDIAFDDKELNKYGRGKLIKFKEMYIKAFLTPFTMNGSIELMKVGYECGFGEKNSAGCGMVERR